MTEAKDLEQVPDTSGIDVVEGEQVVEASAEETAVLEPVDSAEGTEQDAAEGEPENKRRRVLPFLRAHKVAAGGIDAALVVGAIGVGVVSLQAADAGTGGVTAEQKADSKTPAAKTGEKVADANAKDAQKSTDPATAPGANAVGATQTEDAAAGAATAPDPAAPAAGGDSQTSASGEQKADASSGTSSGTKQSAGGSGSGAGSSSGSSSSSGGSSSGSSSSGSSGSSSSGGSSKPASKPAHEHDWQPVTDKQWVPNIVTVKEAYDEPIYEYVEVCSCGEEFKDGVAAAEHAMAQESGRHNSHTEKRQTGTKHHDAVTEDQGEYETVTTGYKCSCGATK